MHSQTHPKRERSGDKPICTSFKYHQILGVKLFNRYVESPPFKVANGSCCALCKCVVRLVSEGTAKAKRLRLYEDSAEATRERLESFPYQALLLERTGLGRKSWLCCHKCKNEIDKYFELIQEINAKKLQSVAAFGEPTGRKRSGRRP